MKLSTKIISYLLLGLLVCSFIGYASTPTTTHYLTGGPYVLGSAYTFWREGTTYYAKNGFGWVSYSGINFSSVIEACIDNMPTYGGVIHLMAAYYEGWVVIDRDGVILEGDGTYNNVPSGIPDNPPTTLYGSVIKVTTAGKDAITIAGQKYGIQIRNLGIWFTESSTGCGITTNTTQTYTVTGAIIQNIKILNCDKDSYAIRLSNFLHCKVENVLAWGGPLLELYSNKENFQQGNSEFDNLFGYIKYDLAPIVFATGPYPIFIHNNDSILPSITWTNLLNMRRIQINNPTAQSDTDYYSMTCWNLQYATMTNFDFEGSNLQNHTVQLGSCNQVLFDTLYTWEQSPNHAYLSVAANNQHLTFLNSYIEGLIDANSTNKYVGCNIIGPINSDTRADLQGLENNTGVGTILSSGSTVTISARFIGPQDYILLTYIDTYELLAGNGLKVDTINRAPTNTFTVMLSTGATVSADVDFFWKVVHKDGWRN
jgi:hypothetical protein